MSSTDIQNACKGGWLNSKQAAARLAYPSIRALYQAMRRGNVPYYRHGKRVLFKPEELDSLIKRVEVPDPPDE